MLKQDTDITGDGGYDFPNGKLPSWVHGDGCHFSFAVWVYRYEDASSVFRNVFSFEASSSDYFAIRQSNTSLAVRLRVNGVTYDFKQAGGSGNNASAHGEWTLIMGYFDATGANVDAKVWSIREGSTDPTLSTNVTFPASPPLSADLDSTQKLNVGGTLAYTGSHLWFGLLGGICFWKDITIDAADVTTVWNSKNCQPWSLPASGNLPGPSYDGIWVLPHCPGGNCKNRGGSNTTGPILGDAIDGDEDVLSFRQETGITDTGNPAVYDEGLTFPTPAADMIFTNAIKEDA